MSDDYIHVGVIFYSFQVLPTKELCAFPMSVGNLMRMLTFVNRRVLLLVMFFLFLLSPLHNFSTISLKFRMNLTPFYFHSPLRGDVKEDLHLDFSLLVDEFGVMRKVDLKSNGKDIRVDNSNRIEYIHLVADFYLNKRIRPQCKAFYKGNANEERDQDSNLFICMQSFTLLKRNCCRDILNDTSKTF